MQSFIEFLRLRLYPYMLIKIDSVNYMESIITSMVRKLDLNVKLS